MYGCCMLYTFLCGYERSCEVKKSTLYEIMIKRKDEKMKETVNPE